MTSSKLYAISDLHINYHINNDSLALLQSHPEDHCIIAGDVCEDVTLFESCMRTFASKFSSVFWCPGNHDLWVTSKNITSVDKYKRLVEICQHYNIKTPEDAFIQLQLYGQSYYLAPMLLLYDYSFRPSNIPIENTLAWAMEDDIQGADEHYIKTHPYENIAAWCHDQVKKTQDKLDLLDPHTPIIAINHFPLRYDMVRLFSISRFSPWCGTTLTESWHTHYNIQMVIYGHLHVRNTEMLDNVRFEEVSLGYPKHWKQQLGINHYVRQIIPIAPHIDPDLPGPQWYL